MENSRSSRGPGDHLVRPGPAQLLPPNALRIEPGPIGDTAFYVLLNDCITEVWVHWLGNRSLPCLNALGKCPPEIHSGTLAWRAYIGGMDTRSGEIRLLSITYDAARQFPGFCMESTAMRLKGRILGITRKAGKKNPQRIWFKSEESWQKKMPPDPAVMTVLNTIWMGSDIYRRWIAENVTGCDPDPTFGHPQEELP